MDFEVLQDLLLVWRQVNLRLDGVERVFGDLEVRPEIHGRHLVDDPEKVDVRRVLEKVAKAGTRTGVDVFTQNLHNLRLVACLLQIKLAEKLELLVQLDQFVSVAYSLS